MAKNNRTEIPMLTQFPVPKSNRAAREDPRPSRVNIHPASLRLSYSFFPSRFHRVTRTAAAANRAVRKGKGLPDMPKTPKSK